MRRSIFVITALLLAHGIASAQPATAVPTTRFDAAGSLAWGNIRQTDVPLTSDNWINTLLVANGTAGIYWTEHLRTQIDASTTTDATRYQYGTTFINGTESFVPSRLSVQERAVAVSQQVQFLHNTWVHPHAGAGVEFVGQHRTQNYDAAISFDPKTGQSRTLAPPHSEESVQWIARPFLEVGYKAYWNRRGFFVNDLRVGVRHRVDEVQLRFGFGVDF